MNAQEQRQLEAAQARELREKSEEKTSRNVERAVRSVLDGDTLVKDAAAGFNVPYHRVAARVREERAKAVGVVT